MQTMKKIKAYDLIGEHGITVEDGQKIYDLVHPELLAGREVELDLAGVRLLLPHFLYAAIGRLFQDIKPEEFDRLFKASNLNPDTTLSFQLMVADAKRYYTDASFREALNAVLTAQAEAE